MGFLEKIPTLKRGSKKFCSDDFLWKMRAMLKKMMRREKKQRVSFNYDPWSYALNFDDGCFHSRGNDSPEIFQEEERGGRSYRKVYALTVGYYY
ncbi:hypothetical protein KSP39_PZI010013 [Platanthera zijinensis]